MTYPKIGIRPVIDGRWGGIRESLEAQTMNMAVNAAKLITETLRYPAGSPVQCVISKTTIGGGAEAAACEEQFSRENVVATLSVTPCWCYGPETFEACPHLESTGRTCRISATAESHRMSKQKSFALQNVPSQSDG